jgi:hypothetical protein
MAKHDAIAEAGVAVMDRPDTEGATDEEAPAAPGPAARVAEKKDRKPEKKSRKAKKKDDDDEYEVEFETPFGKLEFEFEPRSSKERRDREKREKAALIAAKEAAKAEKKAEQRRAKAATGGGGRGRLPLIILAIVLVGGAIVLAYWLFARPVPEDRVPEEFLAEPEPEGEPEPAAFIDRMRYRVKNAVRAGRRASYETQLEEQRRYEGMTQSP